MTAIPSSDGRTPAQSGPRPSAAFLFPCIPATCFGTTNLIILPLWSEAVAQDTGIAAETLLLLGSGQLAATGLAALVYAMFLVTQRASTTLRIGAGLWVIANLATVLVLASGTTSITMLATTRLLSGLGEGLLMATCNARFSRTSNPQRIFLFNQFLVGLYAASMFYVFPRMMHWMTGHAPPSVMIFACLAALGAALIPLASQADKADHRPTTRSQAPTPSLGRDGWLGVAMLFIFVVGFTEIYSSWGRLGVLVDVRIDALAAIMSIGAIIGMAALAVAMLLSSRIGLLLPIGLCLLFLAASAVCSAHASLLRAPFAQHIFALSVGADQVSSLVFMPFAMSLLAVHDPSGRTAAAAPLAMTAGGILGPVVAAVINRQFGAFAIGWTTIVFYAVGLSLLLLISHRTARTDAAASVSLPLA
jgi:hypothetical protein